MDMLQKSCFSAICHDKKNIYKVILQINLKQKGIDTLTL